MTAACWRSGSLIISAVQGKLWLHELLLMPGRQKRCAYIFDMMSLARRNKQGQFQSAHWTPDGSAVWLTFEESSLHGELPDEPKYVGASPLLASKPAAVA